METKTCKKCGIEKPVSDFGKGGKQLRANGEWKQYYHTTCKQCVNHPRVRKDNVDPKVCSTCGISKPLSEYAMEKQPAGMRYRAQCKQCKYEQRMKTRAENPEIVARERERNRWRYNNVEGVAERAREVAKKSYDKNRDRNNARQRERYANDEEYREKAKSYQRNRRAADPEYRALLNEKCRIYHEEHKEELRIKAREYYEKNKEILSEKGKQRYYENYDHYKSLRKAQYDKHRDKLVEDQRRIRDERRQILHDHLGGKCVRCGATERLEFDHIIKDTKSYTIGSSLTCFTIEELIEEANKCQLLCRPCHIIKTKEEGEWAKLTPEQKAKRKRR